MCVRECLTVCVWGGGCRQGGAFAASWGANWGAIGKKPDLRQSHGDPPIVTEGNKDLWLSILNSLPVVHFISLR